MSFDGLAPHYRWMELLLAGNKLQRCRTAFLSKNPDLKDILLMGEGNGRFLVECRRRFKSARITCVDASRRMLSVAQQRLRRHGLNAEGIQFVHANALEWTPPRLSFDAIVTHFFLDCFREDQLARLVAALASAAKPNSVWLLSDFQIPTSGLGRQRAQLIHRAMYIFFRATCRLPAQAQAPPDELLRAQGFSLKERRVSEWGLLRTDRWVHESH